MTAKVAVNARGMGSQVSKCYNTCSSSTDDGDTHTSGVDGFTGQFDRLHEIHVSPIWSSGVPVAVLSGRSAPRKMQGPTLPRVIDDNRVYSRSVRMVAASGDQRGGDHDTASRAVRPVQSNGTKLRRPPGMRRAVGERVHDPQ